MKVRISIRSALFFLYTMTMFMPSYYSNGFWDLVENLVFCAVVFVLVQYRYKPNTMTLLAAAYWTLLVVMTFIHKYSTTDIHLIISNLKLVVCVFFIDHMFRERRKEAVNVLFWVLLIYAVADLVSVILFPKGLYFTTIVWSEWYTSQEAQWVLGNKNNRYLWYLMVLILMYCKYALIDEKKSLIPGVLAVLFILPALITDSSTGIVAMMLGSTALLLAYYRKNGLRLSVNEKYIYPSLNLKYIYGIYIIITVLAIVGGLTFLAPVLEFLFGKDASFTGRVTIWLRTIAQIMQRPILGSGVVDASQAQNVLAHMSYANAHNMLLDTLWEGGLVGLGIICAVFWLVADKTNSLKNPSTKLLIAISVCALLAEGLLEAVCSYPVCWFLLTIVHGVCRTESDDGMLKQDDEE